jgi:hypothetical protein
VSDSLIFAILTAYLKIQTLKGSRITIKANNGSMLGSKSFTRNNL